MLAACTFSATAQTADRSKQVADNWESINQRPYPQWFSDAKLGIFVHWGLYSIPAYASPEGYGEWFYKGLMAGDEGRKAAMLRLGAKRDQSPLEQYSLLPKQWKAEMWDPAEWAELFKEAGAKYVVLVTKHHDGYCLWDWKKPALDDWTSVLSGPERNIVGELTEAVRNEGMKMGFYYSLTEWTNPIHTWTVMPNDSNSVHTYVREYMIPQIKDLVNKYKPSLLFTDGDWDNTCEQFRAEDVISWYYNAVGPEAIVNDRWGQGTQHGFRTPEYSNGIVDNDRPWAECRGLGRSFGVNHNEPLSNYLTSDELIQHFVKLVAAGGGLTLNVGPEADGRIPLLQQERLKDLGAWLRTNGEAIYGTTPYSRYGEIEPVVIERKDKVIDFDWVRNSPDPRIACDDFKAEWHGMFSLPTAGVYTISAEADDFVEVVLFGTQVIDNKQDINSFTMKFSANFEYPIDVYYKERDREARVHLYIEGKDMPRQPLQPIGAFSATYQCEQPYVCYTRKGGNLYAIALGFPQEDLRLNLPDISPSTKITLLGSGKELKWIYNSDGQVVIDTRSLGYSDIAASRAAWVFKLENAIR